MSGKPALIGYRAVVPYLNVVSQVDVLHKEAVVSDSRGLSFSDRPVNSDIFTTHDIVPYPDPALLIFKGYVLGFSADNSVIEYRTAGPYDRVVVNMDIGPQFRIVANDHFVVHDTEGTDLNVVSKLSFWGYYSCRMYADSHIGLLLGLKCKPGGYHAAHSSFCRKIPIYCCPEFELEVVASALEQSRHSPELVARFYRSAELYLVYRRNIDKAALAFLHFCTDFEQDSRDLSHGLDHQDSGHHRFVRKVPLEERLVYRYILDPCHFDQIVRKHQILYPVYEKERIAVRQKVQYFIDVVFHSLCLQLIDSAKENSKALFILSTSLP